MATTTTPQVIPRAVRCEHCGSLMREEARERISDEEVAVRYACPDCRKQMTRHFRENEVDSEE